MSVTSHRGNPLAWCAVSNAYLYSGSRQKSFEAAVRAQYLSSGTTLRYWADFQLSMTAAANHKFDLALKYGESSALLSQDFSPPLRYLTAVYNAIGDDVNASRVAKKLCHMEGDFSCARLYFDDAYPSSIIKKYGITNGENLLRLDDIVQSE